MTSKLSVELGSGNLGSQCEAVTAVLQGLMSSKMELVQGVKDSGFSPNPYSSHFLFFSIYSSYFSFMQAFAVSWSLL